MRARLGLGLVGCLALATLATGCFDPSLREDLQCGPASLCPPDYACFRSQCILASMVPGEVCDPLLDTGCAAGKKCTILDISINECREPGTGTQGSSCAQATTTDGCASSYVCKVVEVGDATCRKLCDLSSASPGCPPQNGKATACMPLTGQQAGMCLIPCDALDQSSCRFGQACLIGPNAPYCAFFGAGAPGTTCNPASPDSCERGASCLDVGGNKRCYKHCNTTMSGMCTGAATGGATCTAQAFPMTSASFGLCM